MDSTVDVIFSISKLLNVLVLSWPQVNIMFLENMKHHILFCKYNKPKRFQIVLIEGLISSFWQLPFQDENRFQFFRFWAILKNSSIIQNKWQMKSHYIATKCCWYFPKIWTGDYIMSGRVPSTDNRKIVLVWITVT